MATAPSTKPAFEDLKVGEQVKAFRKSKGFSLSELARITSISEATLSRVENEQTPVSAHNLYILSQALDVDITAFFEVAAKPIRTGVRSVSRAGEQTPIETARYVAEVLSTDLANKKMHPAVNTVSKRSLEEAGGLASHAGEEFLYVLEGQLILHTDFYSPTLLNKGDSIYFDGSMGHAYVAGGDRSAKILVLTTIDGKKEGFVDERA